MVELSAKLGFCHDNLSPYYPQANGQVEAINKFLKTMIQWMVGKHKSDWHLKIFPTLWAYRTSTKTATSFTTFQLVYNLEAVLLIECEISSFEILPNTTVEEERFLYLEKLDKNGHDAALANEAHKKCVKV